MESCRFWGQASTHPFCPFVFSAPGRSHFSTGAASRSRSFSEFCKTNVENIYNLRTKFHTFHCTNCLIFDKICAANYSKYFTVTSRVSGPLKLTILKTPNSIDHDIQPPPIVWARRRGRRPPRCLWVRGWSGTFQGVVEGRAGSAPTQIARA